MRSRPYRRIGRRPTSVVRTVGRIASKPTTDRPCVNSDPVANPRRNVRSHRQWAANPSNRNATDAAMFHHPPPVQSSDSHRRPRPTRDDRSHRDWGDRCGARSTRVDSRSPGRRAAPVGRTPSASPDRGSSDRRAIGDQGWTRFADRPPRRGSNVRGVRFVHRAIFPTAAYAGLRHRPSTAPPTSIRWHRDHPARSPVRCSRPSKCRRRCPGSIRLKRRCRRRDTRGNARPITAECDFQSTRHRRRDGTARRRATNDPSRPPTQLTPPKHAPPTNYAAASNYALMPAHQRPAVARSGQRGCVEGRTREQARRSSLGGRFRATDAKPKPYLRRDANQLRGRPYFNATPNQRETQTRRHQSRRHQTRSSSQSKLWPKLYEAVSGKIP